MSEHDASYWDGRYRVSDSVWGAAPNRWVEQEVIGMRPGTALDLACGEGRNAAWLASIGWQVIAVDFSQVALAKGAEAAATDGVTWVLDDATAFRAPEPVDLVVVAYLQLDASSRRAAMRNAAAQLAPGGTLIVVAHDSRNLAEGAGGPRDREVLYTAFDIVHDIEPAGLVIEKSGEVLREVEGSDRPAVDALLRARRPV
ncbi:MAG: methyltransferase domain-containing protein [Jatrophihabitans sp.]